MNLNYQLRFDSFASMVDSLWIQDLKEQFAKEQWPIVCNKCKLIEENLHNQPSPRIDAINFHNTQEKTDYLVANVMVDNICNGACQICNPQQSSKIASLMKQPLLLNNDGYDILPHNRITRLYLLGGEPSFSKKCKEILANLPPLLESLWITTNGSIMLTEIIPIADRGINVQINISVDGTGRIFEYARWPLQWDIVSGIIRQYTTIPNVNVCMIATVSALTVVDIENILKFSKEIGIGISWNVLKNPQVLSIKYINLLTLAAKEKYKDTQSHELLGILTEIASGPNNDIELIEFINKQDTLRNISIKNYLGELYGKSI
jgi:hypothetical protein